MCFLSTTMWILEIDSTIWQMLYIKYFVKPWSIQDQQLSIVSATSTASETSVAHGADFEGWLWAMMVRWYSWTRTHWVRWLRNQVVELGFEDGNLPIVESISKSNIVVERKHISFFVLKDLTPIYLLLLLLLSLLLTPLHLLVLTNCLPSSLQSLCWDPDASECLLFPSWSCLLLLLG